LRAEGVKILLGPGSFQPHPPRTGERLIESYPWYLGLDEAERMLVPAAPSRYRTRRQGAVPGRTDTFRINFEVFFLPAHSSFFAFLHPPPPPAANDHEPPIAHPGSYDADRCIHRNDHGQPRGRITPAGKQAAVLAVVVTVAKGYDLSYIWKPQDHAAGHAAGGYYIDAAQAGEPPGR
jgi:hypothetical protein